MSGLNRWFARRQLDRGRKRRRHRAERDSGIKQLAAEYTAREIERENKRAVRAIAQHAGARRKAS